MTGPRTSILGRDIPSVMQRFRTGMPAPFKVATDDVVLEGALVEVQEASGRATRIERVREPLPG
jgi:calcineurin-like phosphoesterase